MLLAILLRVALDYVYINVVSTVFAYQGFPADFVLFPYIESWIAFIILLAVAPKQVKRPSDFFVCYLVFVTAIPFIILYPAMQAPSWNLWYLVATVFVICVFRFTKPFALLTIKSGRKIFIVGTLPVVLVVTFQLLASNGLQNFNLNILLVYAIRGDINTLGDSTLLNYLSTWMLKVIGPVIMAISLLERRYTLAMMVVVLHVVWFGISQHKSVLLYPLLVFVTFWYVKKGTSLSFLPILLLAVTVIGYLLHHLVGDILAISFLVRRALFVPALLTFDYYEFFAQNDFIYWSNSILRIFMPYEYNESVPTLISRMRGGEGGANNHFLATGYMQAGAFGLFLYAVIIIVILNIFDSFQSKGLPIWFVVAVGVVPMHTLFTSSDLPVTVMTHGLGFCIVSLMLVSSRHAKDSEIN